MSETFDYDAFLSLSAKDKAVVRPLAERLRQDRSVASVYDRRSNQRRSQSAATIAKIEEVLERPRVLVLCMSANAFASDPATAGLKSGTFRFRDALNKERRFLRLRLDNAPIKDSLAQFLHTNQQFPKRVI